jgi:hypothetical protein
MRIFCIALITAGLMAAPMAWAGPLAPGKPAGVHDAARHGARTGLLIAGGLAVAAVVAVVAIGGGSNNYNGVLTTGSSSGTTS